MHRLASFLLTLLLVCCSVVVDGIAQHFRRFGVDQGLSQSTVHVILQDSHGFLWIGTQDGLNRYDGNDVQVFRQIPGDSTSLSDNHIRTLVETRDGTLWVGTDNGLNRLTLSIDAAGNGRAFFQRFMHDESDSSGIAGESVKALYEDRRGRLWCGTPTGLSLYLGDGRFARFTSSGSTGHRIGHNHALALQEDAAGNLWVGTLGGGITRLDSTFTTVRVFRHDSTNAQSIRSNFILALHRDASGTLWAGTYGGGLCRYDPSTEGFTAFTTDPADTASISDNRIFAIAGDAQGNLWLGTFGGGLCRFSPDRGSALRLKNAPGDPSSLGNNFVRTVCIDHSGILWAGTNQGVSALDLKPAKFSRVTQDPKDPGSLQDRYVLSILRDHAGTLWVGTNGGVDALAPSAVAFQHYAVAPKDPKAPSGFVYALCEDQEGTLWLGTFGGGLFRMERPSGRMTNFRHDPVDTSSLPDNRVVSIVGDHRGRLLIGTIAGLCVMDRARKTFSRFPPPSPEFTGLLRSGVTVVYFDRDSIMWLGTAEGLVAVDETHGRLRRYRPDPGDLSSISNAEINAIAGDGTGAMWVGTDNGLNLFIPQSHSFRRFYEADGLPNSYVCSILPDHSGHLWISTNRGLSRMTPGPTPRFRNFTAADGLQSNEFNPGAAFRSSDGELFFGGVSGMNRFFPDSVRDNTTPPLVGLTGFRRTDLLVASGPAMYALRSLDLTYADRFFSFEFAALDFTAPERNRFTYMLEGFEETWSRPTADRFARYTNIDPGTYLFRVRAANNDGYWNEEGATVSITITPPYWNTWWFRVLIVVAIGVALVGTYRYRVHRLLEIERMRISIASDLHDDIGSSLTKIALYSDIARTDPAAEKTTELLGKIGGMSREVVATMSDIVWSIDARNDSIGDLLERMHDIASTVLSSRQVRVHFETRGLDPHRKLPVDVRQNVYLIFKEAVTNIARHSAATEASIHIGQSDGTFTLRVSDNGQGMAGRVTRTGHGMRNMEMRAGLVGGTLRVEESNGVSVELTLPRSLT